MIELHVADDRTTADQAVESQLIDLVVAHRVVSHPDGHGPVALPAIKESGSWVTVAEFDAYMDDLRNTLTQWRKFQADACYIEDDGTIC